MSVPLALRNAMHNKFRTFLALSAFQELLASTPEAAFQAYKRLVA